VKQAAPLSFLVNVVAIAAQNPPLQLPEVHMAGEEQALPFSRAVKPLSAQIVPVQ
jgi:hypothetical protein